jgi:hypothetical protein
MAGPFTVSQSGSSITISSTAAGFNQNPANNPYRYYMNNGGGSALLSDLFDIEFADGSGIRLTDFNQHTGISSSSVNVIGIPSSAAGVFANSVNIIGGVVFISTFDIYDLKSGALLINNYLPQSIASGYLPPAAQFGYTSGQLTIQAPTTGGLFQPIEINSSGLFTPNPTLPYVAGNGYTQTAGTGQSSPQYLSGGQAAGGSGGAPWVFSLLVPTPPSPAAPVCFLIGTLIRMADGSEVPIQDLRIGDQIASSKGPLPIKWIAKRTVWKQRASRSEYKKALPVRIQAGSLGDGIPCNDLLVSRCHGIWVDGKVVNASFLENDVNIAQASEAEFSGCIQYYHLEFDEEVLVEANGALACSYVNMNNRRYFDNYPEFISRYCSADLTADNVIRSGPRNRPSLEGHKQRVRRAWMSSGCKSDPRDCNQAATGQWVTL